MDFIRTKKSLRKDATLQVPFCDEKSVQLVRVASFRSDFLQNPYFSHRVNESVGSFHSLSMKNNTLRNWTDNDQ